MNEQPVLAIEIGGTKLQALLAVPGQPLHQVRVAAEPDGGSERIRQQIIDLIEQLPIQTINHSELCAGIGFGGPVDSESGTILVSHQVSGWNHFRFVDWFQAATGIRGKLFNDSDCAGYAEAMAGAGKGLSPIVYMNIGSGIGGAIVIDGKLHRGVGLGAGEIGHLRIRRRDTGVGFATLEDLASGWSLARRFAEAKQPANQLEPTTQTDRSTNSFFTALRQSDREAQLIWQDAIECLGLALANVITLLSPRRIVLGGGVSLVGDLLLDPLREAINGQVFAPFRKTFDVVPAALGEDVVLIGAKLLAQREDR